MLKVQKTQRGKMRLGEIYQNCIIKDLEFILLYSLKVFYVFGCVYVYVCVCAPYVFIVLKKARDGVRSPVMRYGWMLVSHRVGAGN